MKTKNIILSASLIMGLSAGLSACKSQADKDNELKAKIEGAAPGITVTVKDGTATLSGQASDEDAKKAIEENVKKVDGVKSVTNQLEVPPQASISPDQILIDTMAVITKDFPKVQASVVNGEITLSGELSKADLSVLMQRIQETRPKKVINNLTVK